MTQSHQNIRTTAFEPATIVAASNAAQIALAGRWLLGDDASAMTTVAGDLRVLAGIMEAGLCDDLAIRTKATRLIRILERRATRDLAGGLLDARGAGMLALHRPDRHAELNSSRRATVPACDPDNTRRTALRRA